MRSRNWILVASALVVASVEPRESTPVGPQPELVGPGVISTRDYERDGALTSDGRTLYFTKRTIWPYFSVICVSHLENGRWTEPEIAPFSGRYPDGSPAISPNGKTMYFASRRPVESSGSLRRDYDLWAMDWTASGWSAPRHLPAPVNSDGNDLSPSVTRDGALYFVTDRQAARVVRSERRGDSWETPVPVAAPGDTTGYEIGGFVSADERFMVVTVIGRDDGIATAEGIYPRGDLYVRERRDGAWSALRHLPPPINSAAEEGSPSLTTDGRLLFTSERGGFTEHGTHTRTTAEFEHGLHAPGNGLGDLYTIDVQALGIKPARDTATREPSPYSVSGPLREPRIFGDGVISTADDEFGGSFTPDGKTIYFSRSAPHSYLYAIFESHWKDGRWTTPTIVPFSGQYTDSDPILSPDGNTMYWTSDRPVNGRVKHDYDIWMVRRTPNGNWGPPERLPEPINSDGSEFCASAARNGTIYFSSTRDAPPGAIRIYRSKNVGGSWAAPENLSAAMGGKADDPFLDLDIMVDPDERFVLIGSLGRPDGFGHFDVYVSWNHDGAWSPLKHLPAPFNTPARDYSPHISPDGKYVFFSSERGFAAAAITTRITSYRDLVARLRSTVNGSGNIYQIDAAMLDSLGK